MYRVCISPDYNTSVLAELYQKEYFEDVSRCYDELLAAFEPKEDYKTMIERMEYEIFEEKFKKETSDESSDKVKQKDDKKPADDASSDEKKPGGLNAVAASIGRLIKTLIEKIKGMFNKIFNNLSDEDKKYKAAVDRINEELKDNPSLKNQAIEGLESGLISPEAIASMNKLEAEFNALINDGNPKTFREKVKKWKDDVLDTDSKFHKGLAAATKVAGVGTTVATLIGLGPKISESLTKSKEQSTRDEENLAKLNEKLEEAGQDPDALNFIKEKIVVFQYKHEHTAKLTAIINGEYQKVNGLLGKVLSFLDKHPADPNKRTSNITKAAANVAIRDVADKENRVKEKEDEIDLKAHQLDSRMDEYHRQKRDKDTRDTQSDATKDRQKTNLELANDEAELNMRKKERDESKANAERLSNKLNK